MMTVTLKQGVRAWRSHFPPPSQLTFVPAGTRNVSVPLRPFRPESALAASRRVHQFLREARLRSALRSSLPSGAHVSGYRQPPLPLQSNQPNTEKPALASGLFALRPQLGPQPQPTEGAGQRRIFAVVRRALPAGQAQRLPRRQLFAVQVYPSRTEVLRPVRTQPEMLLDCSDHAAVRDGYDARVNRRVSQ